eukprot:gene5643-7790_t
MEQNSHDITSLMRAAVDDDIKPLLKILASGNNNSQLFLKDKKGRTALDWARLKRNYHAVSLLTKAMGSDIHNARLDAVAAQIDVNQYIKETNEHQHSILFKAIKDRDILKARRILTDNMLYRSEVEKMNEVFFTDIPGHSGYTPLILASGLNMIDIVDKLIGLKVPIDTVNKFGQTAFTYACAGGHSSIVRMLLFHGANVHHTSKDGRTGLHYACIYAKAKTVKTILHFMLEQFATFRVNNHSLKDFDPTRWTVYAEIFKKLINSRDNDGKRAIDLLPSKPFNAYSIESRLKLSGVKRLEKLDQKEIDERSVITDFNFHDGSPVSSINGDNDMDDLSSINDDEYMNDFQKSENKFQNLVELKEGEDADQCDEDDSYDENDKILYKYENNKHDKYETSSQFTHDTDNLHVPHNLASSHSIVTATPFENELSRIIELFHESNDMIETWIENGEKEIELLKLISCPLQCGFITAVEKMTEHVQNNCLNRMVTCNQCHQAIIYSKIYKHMTKQCTKRVIACPNAYQGCMEMYPIDHKDVHLNLRCKVRLMNCRQMCDLLLPYNQRDDHEENFCKNRKMKCDLCSKELIANQYPNHLQNECLERKVKCSLMCGEIFKAKDIHFHETMVCVQPCKYKCGAIIGPVERLQLHQLTECPNRPVSCKYSNQGCKSSSITAGMIEEHERDQCQYRQCHCSLGCNKIILRKDLYLHQDTWNGKCTERLVRCPYNLVGWKIMILPERNEGIILQFKRKKSNNSLPINTKTDTINDQIYVRFEDKQVWMSYWDTKFILINRVQEDKCKHKSDNHSLRDHYNCDWIIYSDLQHHLDHDCMYRDVILDVNHNIIGKQLSSEMTKTDNNQVVSSSSSVVIPFFGYHSSYHQIVDLVKTQDSFNKFINDQKQAPSQIFCEFCSLSIQTLMIDDHKKSECKDIRVRCPYGCGNLIIRKFLNDHIESQCSKRPVGCIDCNDPDVWAEEIDEHKLSHCKMRHISCTYNCGDNSIKVATLKNHCENICQLRPILCECGYTVKFIDFSDHQKFTCPDRIVACPQGCGVSLKSVFIENHIELECKNSTYKYQKISECPLGCGEEMMFRDQLEHVNYKCAKRLTECPRLCGNCVALDLMPEHLIYCPKREISCDPCIKTCTKYLHHWFYRQIDHPAMKPIEDDVGNNNDLNQQNSFISFINTTNSPESPLPPSTKVELNTMVIDFSKTTKNSSFLDGFKFASKSQRKSKKQSNQLNSTSLHQLSNSLTLNNTGGTSTSIYYDGNQMKLHNELRMFTCAKHNMTLLMTSIKIGEFGLTEYILKQSLEYEDVDIENIYGDTALTIACRLGKHDFVEILIHHGADVNKETSHGKTALIEATKADVEKVSIIELLIQSGCIADYKTFKHSKTAIDWARCLHRIHSIRILELAIMVQNQMNIIFNAITTGKYEVVTKLIASGLFFHPNNEMIAYKEMQKYINLLDETTLIVNKYKNKMDEMNKRVENSRQERENKIKEKEMLIFKMKKAFEEEENISKSLSKEFVNYDKTLSGLHQSDINELMRVSEPSSLLNMALFIFGIVFEFLNIEDYPDTYQAIAPDTIKAWYLPLITQLFPKVALNSSAKLIYSKLRSFNIDKLLTDRMKGIIIRSKHFYVELFQAIENEEQTIRLQHEERKKIIEEKTRQMKEEIRLKNQEIELERKALIEKLKTENEEKLKNNMKINNEIKNSENNNSNEIKKETYVLNDGLPIPDHEWDSDAEDADHDGEWVKGEWVPKIKDRRSWWTNSKSRKDISNDNIESSQNLIIGKQLSVINNKKSARFVVLSDEIIEKEIKANVEQLIINSNRPISTAITNNNNISNNSTVNNSLNMDNIVAMALKSKEDALKLLKAEELLLEEEAKLLDSYEESATNMKLKTLKRREKNKNTVESNRFIYQNEIACFPFINTILALCKAIAKFSTDKSRLVQLRQESSQISIQVADLELACEELKLSYDVEEKKRLEMEKDLIKKLKSERFYNEKVLNFREKVRVARLLNQSCTNGHTLVSWAASVGAYEVVEEMLSHGATVGYPSELLHMIATYLQLSYLISKKNYFVKRYKSSGIILYHEDGSKKTTLDLLREIEILKMKREKIKAVIHFKRTKIRLPVPEAIYMGKWEIVERIYERRLLHVYFMDTFIFPSPPPPFCRNYDFQYNSNKILFKEIIAYGMNNLSAGSYIPEIGWIPPNHPQETYGELQLEMKKMCENIQEKQSQFINNRARVRILANERKNQHYGSIEFIKGIADRDFKRLIYLAEKRGISIDLESPEGYTALVAASEENVNMINYIPMVNDDGFECLQVEYLLDRNYYRPGINVETKNGHTALIRACELGRYHVVEALLDRLADINYVNKFGRTALHYAVEVGSSDCVRILIERFADLTIKDKIDNMTPYQIAEKHNFAGVMKLLSQFGGGFLGPLQVSRGKVANTIRCSLGCGLVLYPHDMIKHMEECILRPVPCPNQCGESRLLFKEVTEHLMMSCTHRIMKCEWCRVSIPHYSYNDHQENDCLNRLILCPQGCNHNIVFNELTKHIENHCLNKIIDCSLNCGEKIKSFELSYHIQNNCPNRRIPCPLKCRNLIVLKQLSYHMENNCIHRLKKCEFCSLNIPMIDYQTHIEQICPDRDIACTNKCGLFINIKNMEQHLLMNCKHRFITCALQCGLKIRECDSSIHYNKDCVMREISCPNNCQINEGLLIDDNNNVYQTTAKLMPYHLKYECLCRLAKCSLCQVSIQMKNMDSHKSSECQFRLVNCEVEGCHKQLPFNQREDHERFHCRFRYVTCPQGCSELVQFIRLSIHCKRSCKMRFLDCPSGCGVNMRFDLLDSHLAEACVRRHGQNKNKNNINEEEEIVKKLKLKQALFSENLSESLKMSFKGFSKK